MEEGDCVLMDSHLFHCGGCNRSPRRRRLLYFTLHIPGNLPLGEPMPSAHSTQACVRSHQHHT